MTRTEEMMTEERFRALIAAYGAAPARWPEAERLTAAHFAAAEPVAREILEEALKLDALMAAAPAPALPAGLLDAVLASAATVTLSGAPAAPNTRTDGLWQALRALWPSGPAWAPMGVLVGAAALGMVAGVNLGGVVWTEPGLSTTGEQVAFRIPDAQDLANLP